MKQAMFFLATLLIVSATCFHAFAFDISVYYDPISMIRRRAEWDGGWGNCAGEPDYHVWISSVADNAQAIQWWREMGVNRLCVNYTLEDFALLPSGRPDTTFKVINNRWPERMYQYLEAQAV
jgi:hypothetical protein